MFNTPKPTKLLWFVAVLFLIWNGFGCYMYLQDTLMSDARYAEVYGKAMAAVRSEIPVWSIAAYALAVWGGLLAATLLLMRSRLAVYLFIISLVATIISFSWGMINAEAKAASGSYGWVMPCIVILVGLFEIWWSHRQCGRVVNH